MILYFTGTGNSQYVARRIASVLKDDVVSLNERMRAEDCSALTSEHPWVIVAPIYAWNLPQVVMEHLKKTPLLGNKEIYFVVTCGDSCGNAAMYAQRFAKKKGMTFKGLERVVMPDNYLFWSNPAIGEEAWEIIHKASGQIGAIALTIWGGENLKGSSSVIGGVESSVVNLFFSKKGMDDRPFYATDECIGCGVCEKNCPLSNIAMVAGKPQWNGHCTQCLRCMGMCPKKAIEYGKKSQGKNRYFFPET